MNLISSSFIKMLFNTQILDIQESWIKHNIMLFHPWGSNVVFIIRQVIVCTQCSLNGFCCGCLLHLMQVTRLKKNIYILQQICYMSWIYEEWIIIQHISALQNVKIYFKIAKYIQHSIQITFTICIHITCLFLFPTNVAHDWLPLQFC